ncbi:NAD(P)/FAD-dependent oxidoreductase [Variovorax sp. HW608]|uniref:NAD(P)/FAD-dependent oxidoreductase n=1 Tax=Variovorax sp. HW608 TaxID=1034889 RepID=UPI0018D52A3F|nr:FAD-dependent oxidoreductase [Variovorax sp. HW608]
MIIGAGQAGAEVAMELRACGYTGSVTLVNDEAGVPYARPPLSKAYLLGGATEADLAFRPANMYAEQRIELLSGSVESIGRESRRVRLHHGLELPYDAVILATGGQPRRLVGNDIECALNVHYLKTLPHATALKESLRTSSKLVIVGGGYIGLEAAAAARQLGLQVTVLEAQPRLLARVTSEPVSDFYRRLHESRGVDVRLAVQISSFEFAADGRVTAVVLAGGERVACDALLVGIGQQPRTELAEAAGLEVAEGVLVDAACRSSDPCILAIGDCARQHCGPDRALRRIESVDNALQQARIAAAALTGRPLPVRAAPWFWSNQYDARLQSVGIYTPDCERVVRGDPQADSRFSVWYLKAGVPVAADVVSSPRDFAAARKLVGSEASVAASMLADISVPLNYLASGANGACAAWQNPSTPSPIQVPV